MFLAAKEEDNTLTEKSLAPKKNGGGGHITELDEKFELT